MRRPFTVSTSAVTLKQLATHTSCPAGKFVAVTLHQNGRDMRAPRR